MTPPDTSSASVPGVRSSSPPLALYGQADSAILFFGARQKSLLVLQSDDFSELQKSDLRKVTRPRVERAEEVMLYQIVLSVALLFIAFTTLPKLKADSAAPAAKQQTIEPGKQAPEFRPMDQDKPKAIDVRAPDPSLKEIAVWLSANFDLPHASSLPRIDFAGPTRMHQLRYKGLLPLPSQTIGGEHSTPPPEHRREVVAVYDDSSQTIYLPEGWTGATVAEQSIVVHEMVHHLQNVADLKYACAGAREKPAYLAQAEWLRRHGLDLEEEFEVDMFTVVALSACMN
jgi:hypothetical protein